jgi:hypothetical protein
MREVRVAIVCPESAPNLHPFVVGPASERPHTHPSEDGWLRGNGQACRKLLSICMGEPKPAPIPAQASTVLVHLLRNVMGELVDGSGGAGQPIPQHKPDR